MTVTHFSLCVALENFCVLNAPILFHIRLLLCNINPQLHHLHITIINIQKANMPNENKATQSTYYVQHSVLSTVNSMNAVPIIQYQ